PNRVEAYENRGSTENNAGDYNGAIADFDKALEFNPKNWMFFYWRGNAEDKLGNTGNAIKDYVTAIGFHTDRSQVVYGTCIDAMVKAGDYAGAIKIAGDWINISPIANTYAIRGEIEYKSGDYKSAIADYSKAIEI